jgi:hypothetical protein
VPQPVQGALAILEAALGSNVHPISPITKAIGRLQRDMLQTPAPGAARAAPTPKQTPVQLWSSLRPAREDDQGVESVEQVSVAVSVNG